tara:strand:+ start:44484 stop:46313 length:1830 start_codon:yes stop_codon:yes gene_type:complete
MNKAGRNLPNFWLFLLLNIQIIRFCQIPGGMIDCPLIDIDRKLYSAKLLFKEGKRSVKTRIDSVSIPQKKSKASSFRELLTSNDLSFLMEAHNGVSAKIVEEAGFSGIWASGLSMATALGVRDNNEASWTQVLEQLEFMADATSIPILVDGDTGYGNFNNVRRLVQKLCQRGIAGVCIEDKLFPKTNSFIGEGQPLADIDEFCGRIKAGKDTQTDESFSVIARVEALISGWPIEEALRRAFAYTDAGADGILIHSKKSDAKEIIEFAKKWDNKAPLVIVPTMYYLTPTDVFRKSKISVAIWANHNMRAAITAMRDVSELIFKEQTIANVEPQITTVKDVFSLVGQKELVEAEQRYFVLPEDSYNAIILAASKGSKLGPLTDEFPKCMVDIRGKPLIKRLVSTLNQCGISNISVVCGYRSDTVDVNNVTKIVNNEFANTGEVSSLNHAIHDISGPCIITYGDILFRPYILESLMSNEGDIVCAVDASWRNVKHRDPNREVDLVECDKAHTGGYLEDGEIQILDFKDDQSEIDSGGEFIGLIKVSENGFKEIINQILEMKKLQSINHADIPSLVKAIIKRGVKVNAQYINGHWLDIDDTFDLARIRNTIEL